MSARCHLECSPRPRRLAVVGVMLWLGAGVVGAVVVVGGIESSAMAGTQGTQSGVGGESAQSRMVRLAQRYAEPATAPPSPPAGAGGERVAVGGEAGEAGEAGQAGANRRSGGRSAVPGADPGGGSSLIFTTLTALGLVIGLILLIKGGARRLNLFGAGTAATGIRGGTGGGGGAVEVVSRTGIGPKSRVLLLRVGGVDEETGGGRVLVVGEGPAGLQTLAEVSEPGEVASLLAMAEADRPMSLTGGFASLLQRFSADHMDPLRTDEAERGASTQPPAPSPSPRGDRARDAVSGLLARLRSGGGVA